MFWTDGEAIGVFVTDLIDFWARCQPLHPAVVLPNSVITYGALSRAVGGARARIKALGLDPGRPVAVCVDHPGKMLAVALALMSAGYVAAPVNRSHLPHLKAAGVSALLHMEGPGEASVRNVRVADDWFTAPPAPGAAAGGQRRAIFFTSGSTGVPKATVFDFVAQSDWYAYYTSIVSGVSWSRAVILPGLGSGYGFRASCMALMQGRAACYANAPAAVYGLLSNFRAELIIASTQQAAELIRFDDPSPGALDHLAAVWIGGAVLHPDLLRGLRAKLCRRVVSVYGSTEGSIPAFAPDMLAIEHIEGAVGFIAPWADVEVVSDDQTPLPPAQEGAIRYRTRAHAAALGERPASDAWFYPGDLGRITPEGVLCIAGRTDDRLNLGGVKVSADQLDLLLRAHPDVEDGAVCALPGADGVDRLWAGARLAPGVDPEALRAHLQAEVFKLPLAGLKPIAAVPRTAEGKTMRNQLRALLAAARDGSGS
ncbi:MAG: hypothetical protein JWN93_2168 [Hyphomicrobiales bacterium]|nr:hypothetical protein [Hyphomicrobiales bacterium]